MARLNKMRTNVKISLSTWKLLFLIIGIVNLDLCAVRGDNLTTPTATATITTTPISAPAGAARTTIAKKEAREMTGSGSGSGIITKAKATAARTTTKITTAATATTITTTAAAAVTTPTQSLSRTATQTESLPTVSKLGGNSKKRLRIQQCREGCYKMFLSNGVPCQQSRECLTCWSECFKPASPLSPASPPQSSPPYSRKLNWHGTAAWSLDTISMVQRDSLVLVEVAWLPMNWPNQCLVTWEVSGGGLMGNLLTESCNVQLSLWPDTKYRVQVTCKNKLTGFMTRSQPLMVDTAKAAKPPKININHLLRRQHSTVSGGEGEDENENSNAAKVMANQEEEIETAGEDIGANVSVDQYPAQNIAPILPYTDDDDNDVIGIDGNNIDAAVQSAAAEQQMNKHTNFIFNWHKHNNRNMAADIDAADAVADSVNTLAAAKVNVNDATKHQQNNDGVDDDDDDDDLPADDEDNDNDNNNNNIIDDINDIDDNVLIEDTENYYIADGMRHKHGFSLLSLATSIDIQKPLLFYLIAGSLLLLALALLMCLLCRVRRSPDDKTALLRDDAEVSSLDGDGDEVDGTIANGVSLPPVLAIIAADGRKANRLSDLRRSPTALRV